MSTQRKIAIIGAGFGGLSAAWDLVKAGHSVEIFEASDRPGGLATGFSKNGWDWTLEKHYHHVFTTDTDYQRLLSELGLTKKLFFSRVRTATRYQRESVALDSPTSLLKFKYISLLSRLRTGFGLALCKLNPFGKLLERFTAKDLIVTVMGSESWRVIWQPLFAGKFGKLAREINGAWFWARIFARSASLGYYQGGFAVSAADIAAALVEKGAKINYGQPVFSLQTKSTIGKQEEVVSLTTKAGTIEFDRVLMTTDAHLTLRILEPMLNKSTQGGITTSFVRKAKSLQGLGAQTLVLELSEEFFTDKTYWLNINEKQWPFLAVVEQSQLTGTAAYGGSHIVYVAKYLAPSDPLFGKTAQELIELYAPYLEQLRPGFRNTIVQSWVFAERFAQPIVRPMHSRNLPPLVTPFAGIYWASMQHVYPFDRGINYAVRIGRTAAALINTSLS